MKWLRPNERSGVDGTALCLHIQRLRLGATHRDYSKTVMYTNRHTLMVAVFALLLWLGTLGSCLATPQQPDVLDYKGTNYNIGIWFDGLPLEDYFQAGHRRPASFTATSSACWRGYIACWRVADSRLWLTEVFVCTNGFAQSYGFESTSRYRFPLAKLFETTGPAVEATWFTGRIEISRQVVERRPVAGGEQLKEQGTVLVFEKGRLVREEKGELTLLAPSAEHFTNGLPQRSRLGPPTLKPVKQ